MENKLPFIPHIDKIRKFKVMVYINDINSDAGPISFFKIIEVNGNKIK